MSTRATFGIVREVMHGRQPARSGGGFVGLPCSFAGVHMQDREGGLRASGAAGVVSLYLCHRAVFSCQSKGVRELGMLAQETEPQAKQIR